MKIASPVTAALAFSLLAFAQPLEVDCTYDTTYDNANLSLANVACSNGANGLLTKNYTTLGSLPTFPNLGGVYNVTWNSPACGTCYNVTYPKTGTTISVLAVDYAGEGVNLSEEAMNTLTGGLAVELGVIQVTMVQVNVSFCGL